MNLVALPAFSDNYIWMLHDGREALAVDPGDAAPVITALTAAGLQLTGILVTHHHADHIGGLAGLRPRLQGSVHGPARENIPGPLQSHHDGDQVHWNGLTLHAMDVPGHTAGHIAWFLPAAGDDAPILFCGDTLFSGGCGRLFEGTPTQMHQSLRRLAELPADTRICCAHEYTLSNLRFACVVDAANQDLLGYLGECVAKRARGESTLPSRIDLERRINPFLRCNQPALIASARQRGASDDEAVSVFAALREWKNNFQ
jgi:hydroxyacylglutathione hydrolase